MIRGSESRVQAPDVHRSLHECCRCSRGYSPVCDFQACTQLNVYLLIACNATPARATVQTPPRQPVNARAKIISRLANCKTQVTGSRVRYNMWRYRAGYKPSQATFHAKPRHHATPPGVCESRDKQTSISDIAI